MKINKYRAIHTIFFFVLLLTHTSCAASIKQRTVTEVQESIQKAEMLGEDGKYIEAFRMLFDAAYKERHTRTLLAEETGEEYPLIVDDAITNLEHHLINEDYSLLMQWFRDTEIPIEEKLLCLAELQQLAASREQGDSPTLFRKQYEGTIVQLMLSSQLDFEEKSDILTELKHVVQERYTSARQQESMHENIALLQEEAKRQFQSHRYIEAFVLLTEAKEQAEAIDLSGDDYMNLLRQQVRMCKEFVLADESPLMRMFKNQNISIRDKQYFWYDLKEIIWSNSLSEKKVIIFQGKNYGGVLTDILTHPHVAWGIKESILGEIDIEILKKDPGYMPEWLLPDEE